MTFTDLLKAAVRRVRAKHAAIMAAEHAQTPTPTPQPAEPPTVFVVGPKCYGFDGAIVPGLDLGRIDTAGRLPVSGVWCGRQLVFRPLGDGPAFTPFGLN